MNGQALACIQVQLSVFHHSVSLTSLTPPNAYTYPNRAA